MRRKFCTLIAAVLCVIGIAGCAWGNVKINDTNFPDEIFRNVAGDFDSNGDGVLSAEEIANIKELYIAGMGISSLKGVGNFTAMEVLHCHDNQLSALDVSSCTALTFLKCSNNQLTTLNVNGCKALGILNCLNNQLTTLNVSSCASLFRLHCERNQITTLDVSKCTALMGLSCLNNRLTSLNVKGCASLAELYCNNNQLSTLDLSDCNSLIELYCNNNQLTSLNVTKCAVLMELDCHENQISALDVSKCTALKELYCNGNQITALNISSCTILMELDCSGNRISTLDASKCTVLEELTCRDNPITTLNISGCKSLRVLNCRDNQIATLDVSKCTALRELNCRDNPITTLNISGCKSLKSLNCKNNQLATLDVSNKTSLTYLNCRSNGLQTLNISGCSSLTGLICYSNQITALDVSTCPKNIAVACDKGVMLVNTPTIFTDTISATTRRASYSFQINGMAGTKWAVSKGTLPDGLKLNASTGKITGTATKAGTFSFTVQLKDSSGKTATKAYTVNVTQTAVTGSIPATITRRASYTGTPKASGGATPYTWSISEGKLPDGLKINASTGKITGTATKAGTFNFTVKAKDKNGAAGTKAYTVKVTQSAVTGSIPATVTRRASYIGTPKASGGATPYTWSISAGKLPDGLKINASTGKITGTATKAGTFNFTVKAKDKNGAAGTKAYTVKVTQSAVTGDIPTTITRGTAYTGTPKASGGASPYAWTISAGTLPAGLKLNASTGAITGTPTKAGTFNFTVKAKDKNGAAGTKSYTVNVIEPATSKAKSATADTTSATHDTNSLTSQAHSATLSALPATLTATTASTGLTLHASLNVSSDNILESFDGKDSDIIIVKAGKPLTFLLGDWGVNVSGAIVCIDDEPAEGVTISEGVFTLPAEWVYDDFRVNVKATYEGTEIESDELYISSQD